LTLLPPLPTIQKTQILAMPMRKLVFLKSEKLLVHINNIDHPANCFHAVGAATEKGRLLVSRWLPASQFADELGLAYELVDHYVLYIKAKIHYTSFPVASPQSVTSWHGQKSVVSFPKSHYNNLLPTSWQLPRLRRSYGETCLMDFGQNTAVPAREIALQTSKHAGITSTGKNKSRTRSPRTYNKAVGIKTVQSSSMTRIDGGHRTPSRRSTRH